MTPEQRQLEEAQIMNNFSELQKKLEELKQEISKENDENKKQEKQAEIQKMEKDLAEMKDLIDKLKTLQDQDLKSLKTRLEQYSQLKQNVQGETTELLNQKMATPTTYELLKDSGTCNRLLNIISSNPKEFANLPGDTPEAKLEYIFSKIRNSIVLFMKNKLKLGNSENVEKVINNTITPAFERSLMELLRDQGNETNVNMLKGMNKISRDSFSKLINGVSDFAKKATGSYNKISQWINAVDYLSVNYGVFNNPNKSEVLSNPLKFKEYMNDNRFADKGFSPYAAIGDNILKIDENQTFEFGMSLQEKQSILEQIGDIQVVNNPKTTALIAKMLDKPEQFLKKTEGLQQVANGLLDGVSTINSVTKVFGVDILGEITKKPEKRSFLYRIMDFVCKLIGITGGLEGIVKRWRLDRLNLTDTKNESIRQIFKKYKELAGENVSLTITDENSCKTALNDFGVTDPQNASSTKGDFLRDSMVENMDVSLLSPSVVQQILGDSYLKKETTTVKGKTKEQYLVDESKITEEDKLKLAHNHLVIMKSHLENYKDNNLADFYTNIHSTEDIALCITASLYADKDDIIEGVKAKVFLPENYGTEYTGITNSPGNTPENTPNTGLSDLTSDEKTQMQNLVEQSKTANRTCYLENPTYKKYLNIIERDLKLPKYCLEAVCSVESYGGYLYDTKGNILGSPKGAKGLFQFMDSTSDKYMKHSELKAKYGKTFTSRNEFLKDPLASAWAAGIMYSEFMHKYNYNFQSALACYNRGIGNYQGKIGKRNLTSGDLGKLPNETKEYVEKISKNVMQHNSISGEDFLSADLGKHLWGTGTPENLENNNELLIGPKLLAKNKDEIGGLGNSIMNGFQGLNAKTNFPNMDGVVSKNTKNHPNRFNSKQDVINYKNNHSNIKSFMLYFGANNNNNQQTLSDIKEWSERLDSEGIQPVLCTCVGENSAKTPRLKELNQQLIALGKEKSWPVVDFAKSYNKGDITLSADGVHPKSYSSMTNIVNGILSQG